MDKVDPEIFNPYRFQYKRCAAYMVYMETTKKISRDATLPLTITVPAHFISDRLGRFHLKKCVMSKQYN